MRSIQVLKHQVRAYYKVNIKHNVKTVFVEVLFSCRDSAPLDSLARCSSCHEFKMSKKRKQTESEKSVYITLLVP